MALPGGWFEDLPGAKALAPVGHSTELDDTDDVLEVVVCAREGPSRPIDTPPMSIASNAPGTVIFIEAVSIDAPPPGTINSR